MESQPLKQTKSRSTHDWNYFIGTLFDDELSESNWQDYFKQWKVDGIIG